MAKGKAGKSAKKAKGGKAKGDKVERGKAKGDKAERATSASRDETAATDGRQPALDVYRVGDGFDLARADAREVLVGPDDSRAARGEVAALCPEVEAIHERLWAASRGGGTTSLLVVLQGMDTSGKGGASKAVDDMFHPLGFSVTPFGVPTEEEKAHDYLWRIERQLPEPGKVKLFDRSHYESVLVERVHELVPESVWSGRYDEINRWEADLAAKGMVILKFMLHISRQEQKERLLARLDDPDKHWKYNPRDIDDRGRWDEYQAAYQDALSRTSTDQAPWYVVPADRKWHRDWVVTHVIADRLRSLELAYPPGDFDVAVERARVEAS